MIIRNANVYIDGSFHRRDIGCVDGKFSFAPTIVPDMPDTEVIDAAGRYMVPGFIDVHTHGGNGVDVNAADEAGFRKIAAFFASQGTTAWNCSILTDTKEQTLRAIGCAVNVMKESGYGAQLMGIHLEGPFLSPVYKGAMPEYLLLPANIDLVEEYQKAAGGKIRYMTVAPEVAGVQELIKAVSDDIVIAIGHSNATYEESMQAFRNGARCVTHTFNAMRLFHQHEPAIMGAALESDAWCEAICDGRHLVPGTVRMLLKCKGWDRVIAITDSIMAAGLPDGEYKLGVDDVVVVDGDAKLKENGVRAGSTLTTGQALKNIMKFTGAPLEKVLPLLSCNPADALRISDHKGRILPGLDADFVLLDKGCNVTMTVVQGKCVYAR